MTEDQIRTFHQTGHVTVADVFTADEIDEALEDLDRWSHEFLSSLPEARRGWFLESGCERPLLRKLDNPVHYRDVFRRLANHPNLVSMVHQLIGTDVSVFFSQVFMKPPEVGGPKPIHQDNFYFGPDDIDATLTVWIALDDATIDNGCLFYSDVPVHDVLPHTAPPGEPFNPANLARARPASVDASGTGTKRRHFFSSWKHSSSVICEPQRTFAPRSGVSLSAPIGSSGLTGFAV